jgi:hypothetical protein
MHVARYAFMITRSPTENLPPFSFTKAVPFSGTDAIVRAMVAIYPGFALLAAQSSTSPSRTNVTIMLTR